MLVAWWPHAMTGCHSSFRTRGLREMRKFPCKLSCVLSRVLLGRRVSAAFDVRRAAHSVFLSGERQCALYVALSTKITTSLHTGPLTSARSHTHTHTHTPTCGAPHTHTQTRTHAHMHARAHPRMDVGGQGPMELPRELRGDASTRAILPVAL